MEIPLEKAKIVLREYKDANYDASKALQKAGYSKNVATKGSKAVINNALRKVAKEQLKEIVSSSNPMATLLQVVRMSEEDVIGEYTKIVKQDKDLSTKLKALVPLLSQLGVKWSEDDTKVSVPILNLTVSKPEENTTE